MLLISMELPMYIVGQIMYIMEVIMGEDFHYNMNNEEKLIEVPATEQQFEKLNKQIKLLEGVRYVHN